MAKACTDCSHYEQDYEESDGHIIASWCGCRARNGVSNLAQFPFKKTECGKFKEKLNG